LYVLTSRAGGLLYGIISVSHTKRPDGTVTSKIDAPENIVIVHNQNKLTAIP
jgi:hypothetical protein